MKFVALFIVIAVCVSLVGAVVRPEQLFLHLTKTPSVVTVSFVTRGGAFKSPLVQYGTSATKLATTVACVTDAYKTVPTWDAHGAIHTCKISGVANMKKYYWRVGSKVQKVWSNVRDFTARHITPTVTKFAVAGDIGSWAATSQLVVDALAKRTDLAAYVTCGDLSYSNFHSNTTPNVKKNDVWGVMQQKVLSKIPQVPVYGNHDMYDNNGKVYDHRYNTHVSPSKVNQHWFSLDIGGIHLAAIDNLYDQTASSPQVAWLKTDLAAAKAKRDAGKIQHIVVTGHYPLYSNGRWTEVVKVLEPIFIAYGVDVYVCGHVHEYQRSYPLNNLGTPVQTDKHFYTNPKGTVHVTVGTGGFPMDGTSGALNKWQVYKSKSYYGYTLFTSNKAGNLTVDFVDTKGVVRDTFTISRFTTTVKMAAAGSTAKRQEQDAEPEIDNEEAVEEDQNVVEEENAAENENSEENSTAEENVETDELVENSSEEESTTETTEEENVVENSEEEETESSEESGDAEDSSEEDDVQTEADDESEESHNDDEESNDESQNENVAELLGPESESLDFGEKFGDAHTNLGWLEQNSNQVEGTECFSFGTNKWELAVPHVGVYEAKVELHSGNSANDDVEGFVLAVEDENVRAAQLTTEDGRSFVTVAVPVADGRLTLSSPSGSAALCGVTVNVAQGAIVNIDINPSAPSEFGVDDLSTADANDFVVNKQTIVQGFAKMTGQPENRFVVVSLAKNAKNPKVLSANVLIRDLPSDSDFTVSDSIAEFSALSGDSFWKRSGLQIERMEVGHSDELLPKAAQISLITVACVIIVVAVVVIAVVLYRRHKKQQALAAESHVMLSQDA